MFFRLAFYKSLHRVAMYYCTTTLSLAMLYVTVLFGCQSSIAVNFLHHGLIIIMEACLVRY